MSSRLQRIADTLLGAYARGLGEEQRLLEAGDATHPALQWSDSERATYRALVEADARGWAVRPEDRARYGLSPQPSAVRKRGRKKKS